MRAIGSGSVTVLGKAGTMRRAGDAMQPAPSAFENHLELGRCQWKCANRDSQAERAGLRKLKSTSLTRLIFCIKHIADSKGENGYYVGIDITTFP